MPSTSPTPMRDAIVVFSMGSTLGLLVGLYSKVVVSTWLLYLAIAVVVLAAFLLRWIPGAVKALALVASILVGLLLYVWRPV